MIGKRGGNLLKIEGWTERSLVRNKEDTKCWGEATFDEG